MNTSLKALGSKVDFFEVVGGDIETTTARPTHMHIAMVSGEYPPRWGGIGSVVYHLAGHLA
ncbi:MAG: hypothetical protein ACKVHC_06340, partial [Candidatus Poseidoniales archaeon]